MVPLAGFAASGCRDRLGPGVDELAEARSVAGVRSVATGEEGTIDDLAFYHTLEDLFEEMKDSIHREAHEIGADHDAQHGCPPSVFIDYDDMVNDEEFGWEARGPQAPS